MISRVIARGIACATRLSFAPARLLAAPRFNFSRNVQKANSYGKVIEDEIKAEEENVTDLAEHIKGFEEKGWALKREDVLVELSKTVGPYEVRLLSNVKAPTNFGDQENKEEPKEGQQGEEDYQGEMNEVTICVTRKGQQKTMVVHAIVTQGFEVSALHFSPSYAEAKKSRLDIFTTNSYTGPEMESLSDELFEGIYGFLENECSVNDQILESFGDYCIDAEQTYYISWLKDLKSMM